MDEADKQAREWVNKSIAELRAATVDLRIAYGYLGEKRRGTRAVDSWACWSVGLLVRPICLRMTTDASPTSPRNVGADRRRAKARLARARRR